MVQSDMVSKCIHILFLFISVEDTAPSSSLTNISLAETTKGSSQMSIRSPHQSSSILIR